MPMLIDFLISFKKKLSLMSKEWNKERKLSTNKLKLNLFRKLQIHYTIIERYLINIINNLFNNQI